MAQPHTATDTTLQVVTAQPTASPPPVQRKVSIANDVLDNRYDNLAFEPCSKRKGSQVCSPNITAMLFGDATYQVDVFNTHFRRALCSSNSSRGGGEARSSFFAHEPKHGMALLGKSIVFMRIVVVVVVAGIWCRTHSHGGRIVQRHLTKNVRLHTCMIYVCSSFVSIFDYSTAIRTLGLSFVTAPSKAEHSGEWQWQRWRWRRRRWRSTCRRRINL